jgi:hypothetical protein
LLLPINIWPISRLLKNEWRVVETERTPIERALTLVLPGVNPYQVKVVMDSFFAGGNSAAEGAAPLPIDLLDARQSWAPRRGSCGRLGFVFPAILRPRWIGLGARRRAEGTANCVAGAEEVLKVASED